MTEKNNKPVEAKTMPVPTASAKNRDIIAETKAILEKQPKINFLVPLAEGEKPGAFDTVQINGYMLTIQKGVVVELPRSVAALLAEKYRIQMSAGESARIDRKTDVQEALS